MGYWIDESVKVRNGKQIAFFVDEDTDIANLPTASNAGTQQGEDTISCLPCGKGSKAFCIASGITYYLDSSDNWVQPGEDNG